MTAVKNATVEEVKEPEPAVATTPAVGEETVEELVKPSEASTEDLIISKPTPARSIQPTAEVKEVTGAPDPKYSNPAPPPAPTNPEI